MIFYHFKQIKHVICPDLHFDKFVNDVWNKFFS